MAYSKTVHGLWGGAWEEHAISGADASGMSGCELAEGYAHGTS